MIMRLISTFKAIARGNFLSLLLLYLSDSVKFYLREIKTYFQVEVTRKHFHEKRFSTS
jgi:hypothetical protein